MTQHIILPVNSVNSVATSVTYAVFLDLYIVCCHQLHSSNTPAAAMSATVLAEHLLCMHHILNQA